MSRTTSSAFRAAVNAEETAQVYLPLLVISHADITTLRFVSNTEDVVSNGDTYIGYPFDIRFPQERDDQPPQIPLIIDNVDRAIVDEIRTLSGAPTIEISMVLADTPNTVEYGPVEATLRNVTWDFGTVVGDLQGEDFLNEAYPGYSFTPMTSPGLFI